MGVQNFEFFYILGGFQQIDYFWGYEDVLDGYILGLHKIALVLGIISMHFRVFFLKSMYRMGIFVGFAKISNIFFGCLRFLILLGVNSRLLGPSLGMKEK